ncbi:hypothetical protein [Rhodopirellula sp. SWK7]|uniref:hypothetical protein n=1 Tax=Rhodopirellula sp. SWK7 TaxID=595460 RepID=UPI0002BE3D33|nr:hypothetical protein [Rhodopirellula sp. SWK7]EMI47307.1 hypothetical protein RRSWK_00313 [Rhodopirellula sp. SWK7]
MSLLRDSADLQRAVGWDAKLASSPAERQRRQSYLTFQLAMAGLTPPHESGQAQPESALPRELLESFRERNAILSQHQPPIDGRIEAFLSRYFADCADAKALKLPSRSLTLDRHGLARELSLPLGKNSFENDQVKSYRCFNGVLNNPKSDRRTTAGTFHVVEGGLPIPGDKRAVPKEVFIKLFAAAMNPPARDMELPYTAGSPDPARTWVSLMLRPLVAPAVPGVTEFKSMETRFFTPGIYCSNLDFVESIFGNAGDPLVAGGDAGLDAIHWSGHTGCVILATHLVTLTKKAVGLPHYDDATERQRRDRMCWKSESELYNDGSAFKLTCRDESGVIVTLIADNYYGYCKKEVKTQLSYAANLMGGAEEEHAGGALAFASYSLGDHFQVKSRLYNGQTFAEVAEKYSDFIDIRPEGYGIDKVYPQVIYIPESAFASLHHRHIRWKDAAGVTQSIPLSPDEVYIAPSGYKLQLAKHANAPSWRLIGTAGEGVFCHKPCTVSGGGKSEISKSLRDYMLYGPIFVKDHDKDFALVDEIFAKDYSTRWAPGAEGAKVYAERPTRKVLDSKRSLGSVIKLLTPSPDYNDEYNAWLESIPEHVYAIALIVKRFIGTSPETNWRDQFRVDIVNGSPGHELKIGDRTLVGTYLRVGLEDSRWRTFKLRQDFIAAAKVQREDDISASVVIPAGSVEHLGSMIAPAGSYKFVENCEYRLFQRPDDAVHRGLDKQTELDLSGPGNFISNFEPLTSAQARDIIRDAIEFDKFTGPMEELLEEAAASKDGYVVSTADPRIVNGSPTKNPRYLQDRPDMVRHLDTYVAMRGLQLHRKLPPGAPVLTPVGAVLSGRRNNPPDRDAGIRSLAVYSPLHYQELPELIMDYVCSLTGKSPSTTGAGSEGALTKGPFNALHPAIDLNSSIVSMILTQLGGFSTPAGHIGPHFEVGHDISLLIPEVWCRMGADERMPENLIAEGMLEKIKDFTYKGTPIPGSRLGYRITEKFVRTYLARVFDNPAKVFTESILRPETQDEDAFADGILQIAEAQARVSKNYFDDFGYELACPPLRAILDIMVKGEHNGHTIDSPEVRKLFDRDALISSDWYLRRLKTKQTHDIAHWKAFEERLKEYISCPENEEAVERLGLAARLKYASEQRAIAESDDYVKSLVGTIGLDPMSPTPTDPVMLDRLASAT